MCVQLQVLVALARNVLLENHVKALLLYLFTFDLYEIYTGNHQIFSKALGYATVLL